MSKNTHPCVVLSLQRRMVSQVQTRGHFIYNSMVAAAATFPTPNPPMPVLLGLLQDLDAAQLAAPNRTRGLTSARDLKLDAVANALESERAYVQSVVDQSPGQEQHLADLAGMAIKVVGTHAKPILAVVQGAQSGELAANANATLLKQGRGKSRRTVFNWRITGDGGKTWTTAPSTPSIKATFSGLTPLSTYGVQVCITDGDGTTEWSQTVSALVR